MEKIYIVKYSAGQYDSYDEVTIFATTKKSIATKYVTKFNRLLKKMKEYYSQFETNEMGIIWIKEEHAERHFERWYQMNRINRCYHEEISLR